jgi:hypothetical protein
MLKISRINPMGLRFDFFKENEKQTRAVHNKKIVILDMDIETFSQCYYNWQMRSQFIQVAFADLPASQREFLMTGITPAQWDEIWKEKDED